jgi:N-acetylglucosaminyl-diphospho-decaprenol L-rhamnosyltransferase
MTGNTQDYEMEKWMKLENALSEKISIVIIARNRAHTLATALQRLLSLHEPVPTIVVDNHSDDDTVQVISKNYPDVTLIQLPENYGSAGRNIGAEYAQTPYVAFADDDSWWADGALSASVAYFEKYPALGLIQGKILLHGERLEPACQQMDESPVSTPYDFPGKCILGFVACGAIVRKDAFLSVGGFHRQFGVGGEEELIALDLAEHGWILAYFQDILAFHSPSPIRDKTRRKQLVIRNHLWAVWLRRPLGSIFAETASFLKQAITDSSVRKGVLEAFMGLPWIIKERKPLSSVLEREIVKLSKF